MCGIVGSCGNKDSIDIVLEGLKRLEYRGYDSSGICYIQDNELKVIKKKGKLDNLINALPKKNLSSDIAIGHTRWATHGIPSDINSHPHINSNNDLALVHNGIIENYETLKKEVTNLISETDSEIFLKLIEKELEKTNKLETAIINAFKKITGNSSFLIFDKKSLSLWAIKRSAPLIVGKNGNDLFASSDPYALIGFASTIYLPEDEVLVKLHEGNLTFTDNLGNSTNRYQIRDLSDKATVTSKDNFDHFMIKEIFEQPNLIEQLYTIYTSFEKDNLKEITKFNPKSFYIVACGTAWHAGLIIANFIEKMLKKIAIVRLASEFRYQEPLITSLDLVILVSQSGETADTLAAMELCVEKNVKTLAICNVEHSAIYRKSDYKLLTYAGREIGVASTKAFTMQVLTGWFYVASLSKTDPIKFKDQFQNLITSINDLLKNAPLIENISSKIHNYDEFIFTGRQDLFPIALEGALKLKEISYVHAEGYASGELKHGPIALIDDSAINIALLSSNLLDKSLLGIKEVKSRHGAVLTIGNCSNTISDFHIEIRESGIFNMLSINVALQLLAYYIAKNKGTDIDKPRNLAKSVTVE